MRRCVFWILSAGCALTAAISTAAEPDSAVTSAAACLDEMPRQEYRYFPNGVRKAGDPRVVRPNPRTHEERQALHEVLWPNRISAAGSIRHWLLNGRFDCVEQAFQDLDRPGIAFADGTSKVATFAWAIADYAAARQGLTAKEIDALLSAWRQAQPRSMLPDLLGPRLFQAAAWEARGNDYADKVSPEGIAAFRALTNEAHARLGAASAAARSHVLFSYINLWVMADNGANAGELERVAMKALSQFPDETALVLSPANRLLPQWGGSFERLERFASKVHEATRDRHGARAYAMIYTNLFEIGLLPKIRTMRVPLVRQGLVEGAKPNSYEDIYRLQSFACAFRDSGAMERVRGLWAEYSKEPRVWPPSTDLPATCREWAASLDTGGGK